MTEALKMLPSYDAEDFTTATSRTSCCAFRFMYALSNNVLVQIYVFVSAAATSLTAAASAVKAAFDLTAAPCAAGCL